MSIIAFSGPENLRGTQESYVCEIVRRQHANGYVSGCARGVDSAAGWEALKFFPQASHTFVVPNEFRYNVEMVKTIEKTKLSDKVQVVSLTTGGPLERNQYMDDISDELVAFPKTKFEIIRSGTWHTIRYAQKIGNKVTIYPLDVSGPLVWDGKIWKDL